MLDQLSEYGTGIEERVRVDSAVRTVVINVWPPCPNGIEFVTNPPNIVC